MAYYYVAILLPATRATPAHPTIGRYSFGNDFYPIWLTSRKCLLHRCNPYTVEVTREIQAGIFGRALSPDNQYDPPPAYRTFSYPAFTDFFGGLVAWLSFRTARIVLVVLLPCLTGLSMFLWSRGIGWRVAPSVLPIFTVLTLSSYSGLEALHALQPGLAVGFLISAAVAMLVQNKPRGAGCLLACATIKPQVCLLLIFYLGVWALADWRERGKFAVSFAGTLAALIVSAMLVWPNWIVLWLQVLFKYPSYSRPPLLPDLFGPYLGGILLVLALAWLGKFAWDSRLAPSTSSRFSMTVCLLLAVTTVTLLPEHALYDHIVLLPGIMLVARSWKVIWSRSVVSKVILGLGAGTIFWPWIVAPAVAVIHVAAPGLTSTILLLPLRTATVIPFVVLGMLLLVFRGSERASGAVISEVSGA